MSLLAGEGEAEPRCLVHDLQLRVAADPAFTAGLRQIGESALSVRARSNSATAPRIWSGNVPWVELVSTGSPRAKGA